MSFANVALLATFISLSQDLVVESGTTKIGGKCLISNDVPLLRQCSNIRKLPLFIPNQIANSSLPRKSNISNVLNLHNSPLVYLIIYTVL